MLYLFPNLYYIYCHNVAHELDVNNFISVRDYEETPSTFVASHNGQILKMIKGVKY